MMTKDDLLITFGVDPDTIGYRNRGWWIVKELGEEEIFVGAQPGDLCIKTRDGSANGSTLDPAALMYNNFVGHTEDRFDYTYVYYYFRLMIGTI